MRTYCAICDKHFSREDNYHRHKRVVHHIKDKIISEYVNDASLFKCLEGCGVSFRNHTDLRMHLQAKHDIVCDYRELSFNSFCEFVTWRTGLEKYKNVRYEKNTGRKKPKGQNVERTYYECIRSGKAPDVSKPRKRRCKSQGSRKINCMCTSHIILTRNLHTDLCMVKYYKSHYGHTQDIKHLPLSKMDRDNIVEKLIHGESPKEILESTKETGNCQVDKTKQATLKDIVNIRRAYNIDIKYGYSVKDDATAIELWIKYCTKQNNNPIMFYKKQGVREEGYALEVEDFCLILMNNDQCKMFLQFGTNVVSVDCTSGINDQNFEMTTISVIDGDDEGCPVAMMFSNRNDTNIYKIFFAIIKDKIGRIQTKILFTDVTNIYVDAWTEVMGKPLRHLFSSCQIDKAWMLDIKEIYDTEKAESIHTILKHIKMISDEKEFLRKLDKCISILNCDPKINTLADYINKRYYVCKEKWAYCYRESSIIHADMQLENMCKEIKRIYWNGQKNKRFDKKLHALYMFALDKNLNKNEKIIAEKENYDHQLIKDRHYNALKVKYLMERESDGSFALSREGEISALITPNSNVVCCTAKCDKCHVCMHTYGCTCVDFNFNSTICKHIHYICLKSQCSEAQSGLQKVGKVKELLKNSEQQNLTRTCDTDTVMLEVCQGKEIEITLNDETEQELPIVDVGNGVHLDNFVHFAADHKTDTTREIGSLLKRIRNSLYDKTSKREDLVRVLKHLQTAAALCNSANNKSPINAPGNNL